MILSGQLLTSDNYFTAATFYFGKKLDSWNVCLSVGVRPN